jgi:hypothetical protein
VPPVPTAALKSLHKAKDYEGMVRLIRKSMNVEIRLVVARVNRGGQKNEAGGEVPAWIEMPVTMPRYGTAAFQELKLTMFIRKSFLAESTYDSAIAIAHELSHVVLDSPAHPLCRKEKAVDLTAMLLAVRGFVGEFERLGAEPLHAHNRDKPVRQNASHGGIGRELFELAHKSENLSAHGRMRVVGYFECGYRSVCWPSTGVAREPSPMPAGSLEEPAATGHAAREAGAGLS